LRLIPSPRPTKCSNAVRPRQTAIGRPAGTLLGSAPVPVAVSAVRAVPSAVRRGIFVEPKTKIIFSPVGAASSVRPPDDVAPNGALSVCGWWMLQICQPFGLRKICVPSVFHRWLKIQSPFAHGHHIVSSVPRGTFNLFDAIPSHKWLGYCRGFPCALASLRLCV
jgi:hypothetical protein